MSYLSEFIDRNTKDLQKITKAAQDAAMMTAYGLAGSNQFQSSSGKNYGINKEAITEHLQPNLDQDLAAPVNQALQDINVPKPNTEQLNLSPNLGQDLTKVDLSGGQSMDVTQAIPNLQQMPNVDQDLTKVSVKGLQESAVKQAGDAQDALIDIGTAVQEQAVQSGKTGQEALVQAGKTGQEALVQAGKVTQEAAVQAGKAVQEQAVQTATQVSGGQKNQTLEAVANNTTKATENVISTATKGTELGTSVLTKGVETQVQQGTKYVEEKVMPVVVDAAKFYTENYPAVKLVQETVHEFEKLTPRIEQTGMILNPGSTQGTEGAGNPQLSADTPNLGDDQVFGDLEKATGKDSKLTEEERLRRIRRLLLNRYGRENTILTTGPGDTRSRRRYAI